MSLFRKNSGKSMEIVCCILISKGTICMSKKQFNDNLFCNRHKNIKKIKVLQLLVDYVLTSLNDNKHVRNIIDFTRINYH